MFGIDKVGGYSEVIDGEIVSSQTDRVDVVGKNLFNADAQIEDFTYVGSNGVAYTKKVLKSQTKMGLIQLLQAILKALNCITISS